MVIEFFDIDGGLLDCLGFPDGSPPYVPREGEGVYLSKNPDRRLTVLSIATEYRPCNAITVRIYVKDTTVIFKAAVEEKTARIKEIMS